MFEISLTNTDFQCCEVLWVPSHSSYKQHTPHSIVLLISKIVFWSEKVLLGHFTFFRKLGIETRRKISYFLSPMKSRHRSINQIGTVCMRVVLFQPGHWISWSVIELNNRVLHEYLSIRMTTNTAVISSLSGPELNMR